MAPRVLRDQIGFVPAQPYLFPKPCRIARHEPEHRMVGDAHVPVPAPLATRPVTLATCPKPWNCKLTAPRELIWPDASIGVFPAELTRPPDTKISQL